MKRIYCFSDVHLDHVTRGVSRFSEIREAMFWFADEAIRNRADLVCFLGDLCDPDHGGDILAAVEVAIECALRLSASSIPSIWQAGNHDVLADGSGLTTLSPLRSLERHYRGSVVYVCERPCSVKIAGLPRVVSLPFTAPGLAYDPEAAARDLIGGQTDAIVLSHLSVPGIVPGEETTEMPRGREITFPFEATRKASLRLQGHYHRRQSFDPRDGGPPIEVVGSLGRLTFGEESNTPGYLVAEVA